jgi:hypothetical protein
MFNQFKWKNGMMEKWNKGKKIGMQGLPNHPGYRDSNIPIFHLLINNGNPPMWIGFAPVLNIDQFFV